MSLGELAGENADFPPYRAVEVNGGLMRFGRCIARGADGSAIHEGQSPWGEPLAIRILPPGVDGASERDALLACRHPRITHLHAAFEHEGRMHLALQHGGIALSRQAPFELPQERLSACLRVGTALLEALHFMHRFGYAHGGVAPRHVVIQAPSGKSDTSPAQIRLCGFSASGKRGADAIGQDIADARALLRHVLGDVTGVAADSAVARVAAVLDEPGDEASAARLWDRLAAASRA